MPGSVPARVRAAALAAASVVLVFSATPVAATTPLGNNLVKNPGAEAGTAGADGTVKVPIPSWQTATNSKMTVVEYGTPGGYPSDAEGQRLHMGDQFFATGLETSDTHSCSVLQQTIHLVNRNTLIDSGKLRMNFGVFIATFDSQTDTGWARVMLINGANNTIMTLNTATASKTNAAFQLRSLTQILPVGTRFIKVLLMSSNHQGAECDTWFDRVSLKLIKIS